MNDLLEILKYTIPSLVVLAVAWYLLKGFTEANRKSLETILQLFRMQEQSNKEKQAAQPKPESAGMSDFNKLQLQAYERMTLFLERINPVNLIPRVLPSAQTAGQLQKMLLQTVREEYEHNLSQQIYLSNTAWEQIKAAKEHVIQLINASAGQTDYHAPATGLAQKILTTGLQAEKNPVEETIRLLKSELGKKYR